MAIQTASGLNNGLKINGMAASADHWIPYEKGKKQPVPELGPGWLVGASVLICLLARCKLLRTR